ncbi:hypothetical protein OHC33_004402 [Knufia fluminis]|uniref:Cupin type-2 domain-containing protein n=1 Tax=Knufia fluminis TaxID=191047 RepID=A0AAN8EFY0_9EURO|nr:hypothetical protein OHC33_004402 [Knufia fluminis]
MLKQLLPNGLPVISRFITDHNAEGQACFSNRNAEVMSWVAINPVANFALGYTTSRFPVKFADEEDITEYEAYLKDRPGITIPGGTVLRFVDMAPGETSPMHRTVSLDYGVVLEGEVELVLDSGETRTLRRGDVAIQRGTKHAWKNAGAGWCRMMYVLQESKPFKVAGKTLGEDYGEGMGDVRASGPKAAS